MDYQRSQVLLTVREIAVRLQVRESWVYRHAQSLGVFRLGKYLRFSWPKVLECLSKQQAKPGGS
jgi:hypothetical protein